MLNKPLCCPHVSRAGSFEAFPYLTALQVDSSLTIARDVLVWKRNKTKELVRLPPPHPRLEKAVLGMLHVLLGVLHVPHEWEERALEISAKVTSNRGVMLGVWGTGDSSELRYSTSGHS